ncbi:MAG TPA: hypothetical protein VF909_08005, partial [Roseiflexaceae bacterium]
MLYHSSYRVCARILLLALVSSLLSGAPRGVQGSPAPIFDNGIAAPGTAHTTIVPATNPHLPSLTLHLVVAPDPIAVGETATFSITIENGALDPANDLVITLPTPDGALAL